MLFRSQRGLDVHLNGNQHALQSWRLAAAGDVQKWQTPWPGGDVALDVPLQPSDWRHLCVRAWVD